MTASITRCCKSIRRSFVRGWLLLAAALLLGVLSSAHAAEVDIRNAALDAAEDGGYVLTADLRFDLPPRISEAISRGVTMVFVLDIEIERPRWLWFNERRASRQIVWRLSYHALTRQYRLSTGALYRNFNSLDDALIAMKRIRAWPVIDRGVLKAQENYEASLRFHVDLSELPKPLQVNAIASRDWNLSSDTLTWVFLATGTTQ